MYSGKKYYVHSHINPVDGIAFRCDKFLLYFYMQKRLAIERGLNPRFGSICLRSPLSLLFYYAWGYREMMETIHTFHLSRNCPERGRMSFNSPNTLFCSNLFLAWNKNGFRTCLHTLRLCFKLQIRACVIFYVRMFIKKRSLE